MNVRDFRKAINRKHDVYLLLDVESNQSKIPCQNINLVQYELPPE